MTDIVNIDYLTNTLNRSGLFTKYENAFFDSDVQIMFFDLDNFKTINDMYGHNIGDSTLKTFANILINNIPDNSFISRLGGDEFVAIIPNHLDRLEIEYIANNILNATRDLRKSDHIYDILTCSIGILNNFNPSSSLDEALVLADKALYYSKDSGRNSYTFYSDIEKQILREKFIEAQAPKALKENKFEILYHPILHLHSSELIRNEACCLWKQDDGTYLGRNDFRPILEKNGFIKKVDLLIFEEACKDMAVLRASGRKKDVIGIQLSYLHILDNTLIDRLKDIMGKYGVVASDFEINIDEKSFGTRTSIEKLISNMKILSEEGFSLALSKFGEDFSSMRYLSELPISAVKFDGEFIAENISSDKGLRILKSTADLGKGFKLAVIACEVDNSDTMTKLVKAGFDAATGDYFCKKLPFDSYLNYINTQINIQDSTTSFRFIDNLWDSDQKFEATISGEGLEYTSGISDNWGAIKFPGGPVEANYIKLPNNLFEYSSYTVSMWLYPYELQNWVSAFYIRYTDGFTSFMPNVAGGRCIFRVKEDLDENWYDALSASVNVGKWTFVAFSYDSFTQIIRLYINGELSVLVTDAPNLQSPQEIWLGADNFQISYCGLISGLQINKGSLTGETIKECYNSFMSENNFKHSNDSDFIAEYEVHDPAIFEDVASKTFYIYGTEGVGFSSRDLIHWNPLGKVVKNVLEEAKDWTNSDHIWAPDIVKIGDQYRLYCSNSSWGVQQSCIFMATSKKPYGPFIPRAAILKTDDQNIVNGIDANIIEDYNTKQQYMVYGSFWGGVHIIELDRETGLALPDQGIGKQLACRPLWNNGAIEGPYIIYHPETKYYYLFVSYGSLTCDYNIRVGRSRDVLGPYLDYHGNDLKDLSDESCSTGLLISCGYKWLSGQAYMGPGHNSILLRENGEMYLVSHIRRLSFNKDPGPGLLQIRKMIMTPDGWPIALSQPYNSETLLTVREALLYGEYERIELRPSLPQGIQHAHPMVLHPDGRLEIASIIGTWEITGPMTMLLRYGPITEFVHFEKGLDKENNQTTVVMCGLTSQGICTWAKKERLIYQP